MVEHRCKLHYQIHLFQTPAVVGGICYHPLLQTTPQLCGTLCQEMVWPHHVSMTTTTQTMFSDRRLFRARHSHVTLHSSFRDKRRKPGILTSHLIALGELCEAIAGLSFIFTPCLEYRKHHVRHKRYWTHHIVAYHLSNYSATTQQRTSTTHVRLINHLRESSHGGGVC